MFCALLGVLQLIREVFLRLHIRRRHTFASLWGACLRFASLSRANSCVILVSSAFIFQRLAEVWYSVFVKRSSFKKFAESSKAFIFQKFAVKFYFGLSLHIFQHGSSLSLENVCDYWCMHQTGFSSAAVCHKVNLPTCVARRPLCLKVNLPSFVARQPLRHKVNLPRCEARRRHLIMTCDIFGTGQTNTFCALSFPRNNQFGK